MLVVACESGACTFCTRDIYGDVVDCSCSHESNKDDCMLKCGVEPDAGYTPTLPSEPTCSFDQGGDCYED